MIHSPKLNDIEVRFLTDTEIRDIAYPGMKASYLTDEELAAVSLYVEETISNDVPTAQSILHKRQVFNNNRQNFIERHETVGSDKFSLSK